MRPLALFILLLSSVVCATCLPECHPDYAEWVSVGMPASWCYARQCRGDTDGLPEGNAVTGIRYLYGVDRNDMLQAWYVKEPPEGSGLTMDELAADLDHRVSGSPYTGYYRVGTNDWAIFHEYYLVKEPPKGPGVPECDFVCPIENDVINGFNLSLRVQTDGDFEDKDTVNVFPGTILEIGVVNASGDKSNIYDAYVSITDGLDKGSWTGDIWVYDANHLVDTYFGTTLIPDMDTWFVETISNEMINLAGLELDPPQGSVSASMTYQYDGPGEVVITLLNEFFELVDTLTIQGGCYAGMEDYDEWISVGAPDCWCYRRNCYGDTDDWAEGAAITGIKYVFNADLSVFLSSYGVKEAPKGPGIATIPNGICADFDRQVEGNGITGFKRVFNNDLAILLANYGVKEPPKGPGVPECEGLFYFVLP